MKERRHVQMFRITGESNIYSFDFEISEKLVLSALITVRKNFVAMSELPVYAIHNAYLTVTIKKI